MHDMPDIAFAPTASRSIAGIGVFGDNACVLAALRGEFGIAVPTTPAFVHAGEVRISCLAPNRFMISAAREAGLPDRLATILAGLAAVTDQSDMWDISLLAGPSVRDVLARLVPVDLHPDVFCTGHLALTRAGHVDVRLFRVAEVGYELAILRSYAADFWRTFDAGR